LNWIEGLRIIGGKDDDTPVDLDVAEGIAGMQGTVGVIR
jgi:hypothetical protein